LPPTIKDALNPPIPGLKDKDGNHVRFTFPDPLSVVLDMATGQHTAGHILASRLSPVAQLAADYIGNRDYRGDTTRATPGQAVGTAAKDFAQPIGAPDIWSGEKPGGRIGAVSNALTGIGPAPRSVNIGPGQRLAEQMMDKSLQPPRDPVDRATKDLRDQLIAGLRQGGQPAHNAGIAAVKAGKIDENEWQRIQMEAREPTGFAGEVFHLPLEQALQVYKAADDREKSLIGPMLRQKAMRADRRDVLQQINQ
jgi:hypothetical protein